MYMLPTLLVFIALAFPLLTHAEVPFPQIDQVQQVRVFSYEDKDWGIAPRTTPKSNPLGVPTPKSIPGGRVITTLQLKALLDANKSVLVIDVLDSKTRATIPGAYWLPGTGNDQFYGGEQGRFAQTLEKLSGGDKNRPLVFLCFSSQCWESYNAALRAMEAGYQDVIWYRGGTNAWMGPNFEQKSPERINW